MGLGPKWTISLVDWTVTYSIKVTFMSALSIWVRVQLALPNGDSGSERKPIPNSLCLARSRATLFDRDSKYPSSPLFKLRKKKEGPSLADLLLQIHRVGCCFLLLVLCVFFGDLNVFQILLSSEDEGDIISSLVLV